jgi:bifunctional DNA-binding transcriptional regulator/antitoxin component of YhaV-PrlF toxin-antitoxin module
MWMSTIVKADATGSVTLPAELCRAAGIAPGADLVAEIQDGRIIVGPAAPPLAERMVARAQALAPGVLDALPDDLAAQHDHYLYGVPKRPE